MTIEVLDYKCPHCLNDNAIEQRSLTDMYVEQVVVCRFCHKPVELIAVEGLNNTVNIIASAENDLA